MLADFIYETLIAGKQERGVLILVLWGLPFLAYIIDFITGVDAAKAVGEKLHSGGYRRTFKKISYYWMVQLMAMSFDIIGGFFPFYELPYASMIATAGILLNECSSVRENFKKMKADNVMGLLNLTDKMIAGVINAKDKKTALKAIAKIISENKEMPKTE